MESASKNEDEKIFSIVIPEKLWSVKYSKETPDELSRLLKEWNNVNYLYNFFKRNEEDLRYFNVGIQQAVRDTRQDRNRLEQMLLDPDFNLEKLFRPLDNRVGRPGDLEKAKGKPVRKGHPSWLRIYAIRLSDGKYIITGGAIKLTEKMDEREHLRRELLKLERIRNLLKDHGVFDDDGFIEFMELDL